MTFYALIALVVLMSYIGLKTPFFLFKLLAGMSWFGLFIYWMNNSISLSLPLGDPAQVAFGIIMIGFGVGFAVYGLGREIDKNRQSPYKGMSYKSTSWKFGMKDEPTESRDQKRARTLQEYRDRVRRAVGNDEE